MDDGEDFDGQYTRSAAVFGSGPESVLALHEGLLDGARPVLDIGAGQGRNALYLARRGHRVEAIDPSEIAVRGLRAAAAAEALPLVAHVRTHLDFEPGAIPFGAILIFGLVPLLRPPELGALVERVRAWSGAGTLVFVTAFSTKDEAHARCERDLRRIGPDSFVSDADGRVRTFLRPGAVLGLFAPLEAIHHAEGLGPVHHHGDGVPERHEMLEAVFRVP